jgi:hypothetical protein
MSTYGEVKWHGKDLNVKYYISQFYLPFFLVFLSEKLHKVDEVFITIFVFQSFPFGTSVVMCIYWFLLETFPAVSTLSIWD